MRRSCGGKTHTSWYFGYGHFEGLSRYLSEDVQRYWICELGFQERDQDQMYKLGRYECTGTVSSLRLHGITLVRTQ